MKSVILAVIAWALALAIVETAEADCRFVRTWQCSNGFCTWQEVWNCLPVCRRVCSSVTDEFGFTR